MTMNISETRDRVAAMLAGIVGRVEMDTTGALSFSYESTRVYVGVQPFGDTSHVVMVWSITNVDLSLTPDLYEFVATHGDDWVFGHLALWQAEGKGALVFRHTLLADFLDEAELRTAVAAVAVTADEIDDQIKGQFGGRLATDVPDTTSVS